jgi:thiol-disulfide isomerase/thioredoxin
MENQPHRHFTPVLLPSWVALVTILVSGCVADVEPADAVDRAAARIVMANGTKMIVVDTVPPVEPVSVLWLAGRGAETTSNGFLVPDGAGGVLRVSRRLTNLSVAGALESTPITAVATAPGRDIWLLDAIGGVRRHDEGGRLVSEMRSILPVATATVDAVTGSLWIVRASDRFTYRLPGEQSPLFGKLAVGDTVFAPVGAAVIPEHSILVDLANAGHLLARGDTVWYAPFIRDEVLAMNSVGDTLWRVDRGLPVPKTEPRFEVDSTGAALVDYHPVNLGLRFGPQGTLYVLSTPEGHPSSGRLDELNSSTGDVIGTAALGTAFPTLAVDDGGRVYQFDPTVLVVPGGSGKRTPLRPFSIPRREGGTLSDTDLRGAPTLLNFWATWCGPCRDELPALDSLRKAVEPLGARVVGMNDDRDSSAARRFIDEIAPGFPIAYGLGDLQQDFAYIGLPWTVLVDTDGKMVGRWIGELEPQQLKEIRRAIEFELRRVNPADSNGHSEHQ